MVELEEKWGVKDRTARGYAIIVTCVKVETVFFNSVTLNIPVDFRSTFKSLQDIGPQLG